MIKTVEIDKAIAVIRFNVKPTKEQNAELLKVANEKAKNKTIDDTVMVSMAATSVEILRSNYAPQSELIAMSDWIKIQQAIQEISTLTTTVQAYEYMYG